MGRDVKLLGRFPHFMRTDERGKALGDLCNTLGKALDESERRLGTILKAHRLKHAEHEIDIQRLAALLGMEQSDFALLRLIYEAKIFGERQESGYQAYLDQCRDLVRRTVQVYSEGCGTIWALLEGASIQLAAETLRNEGGAPILEHPDEGVVIDGQDRGGFIHRLAVRYRTYEAEVLAQKEGYIYLLENPLVDYVSDEIERRQHERFRITKGGFFDTVAGVKITGVQGRTVLPRIINITTRQGLGFLGGISDGETLLFTRDGKAFLNGLDVTERCYYFHGALYDQDAFNPTRDEHPFVVVTPAGALQRKFPRPTLTPLSEIEMPVLPLGDSDWRFSIREGVFDGDSFNRCVFALPEDNTQLNALPASAKVQLEWQQHEPFSATLLIPDALKSLDEKLVGIDLRAWVRTGLERFRGAGIRINVEYYSDEWLLDHSVLRDTTALTGSGVFFDETRI